MPEFAYSSTTFLAYCVNHHFYGGTHYVWAAGDFYPYRQPNPKSSNPLLTYVDIYEPWKDSDPYDKFLVQHRLALRKGVVAQQKAGQVSRSVARRLRRVIDKIDIRFLYPIVYRIDLSAIPQNRQQQAGSASSGSNEVLIADLSETEFDILFLDFRGDPDFDMLNPLSGAAPDPLGVMERNSP